MRSGQAGVAIEHAQQAFELARTENDPDTAARALIRIGDLHYRFGHFEEARDQATQALAIAGKSSQARADAFILLGNCTMEVGSLDAAEQYYQAAADLSRQIGYDQALVNALHDLGACIYALRGQFSLAIAVEEQAFSLACQIDSPYKANMLIAMCFDCMLIGQYQRAMEIKLQLQPLVTNNRRLRGYDHLLGANLSVAEGNLPAAIYQFDEAHAIAKTDGDLGLNVFLRIGLSAYYQSSGDYAAAYDWASDAITWASRLGSRRLLGRAFTERGRSSWLIGDHGSAEADLRKAIEDLAFRKQAYDLARARLILAALLFQRSSDEAEVIFVEAVSLVISGGYSYLLERERALVFPLIALYMDHSNPSMQAITTTLLARLMSIPPPLLRITTFGRFIVYRNGMAIRDDAWHRQAGDLFRLLLISPGRTLSREQIIDNLWPEKSLSKSMTFFHQATSCLRRAVEPDLPEKFPSRYLLVEEGRVTLLLPPGSQVDYEAFEQHIKNEEYQKALLLYQGEPFLNDRYHDWASSKREQLLQLHVKALLRTAIGDLESGNADQALAALLQVLNEEPWNEQAGFLAMKACLEQNNRPMAIRIYSGLRSCLDTEFGILPMPELQQLYASIKTPLRTK